MAVMTFVMASADNSKEFKKDDSDYSTAHDAATGTIMDADPMAIGQSYDEPYSTYYVYRAVFSFDTSGLNDAALIKSAYLYLRVYNPYELQDTILIKNGMPTYPHTTPEVGDFDIDHYSGNGGSKDCSDVPINYSYITLNLSATGLNWINKTGWTKFIIVSQKDNIEDPPTALNEYIRLYGYSGITDYYARLVVTYYLPSGVPLVTSVGPCIDRQSTTMTAVGNVTDDGGGYEERGFEYYEDTTGYDSEMYAVRELGVFTGTGNFEMTIYGLKPETTYQIRAWVRNSFGTTYGDWYTCTTKAMPGYGVYEESNSPTICFYLSEDDGKTWGQKHGPYTEDQADIEITKVLVRGSGKKKIKFTSDVLTGISTSVMCKLDLKAR